MVLRWLNLGKSCHLLNYLHCTVLSTFFLFKRKKGLEAGALPRVPCQLLNYLHCTVLSTFFLFKRKKGLEAGALPRVPWV